MVFSRSYITSKLKIVIAAFELKTAEFNCSVNITGNGNVLIKKVRLKENGAGGTGRFNFNGEIYSFSVFKFKLFDRFN